MWLLVAGAFGVVVYLMSRPPSSGQNGALPPASQLPATGGTGITSPATSGPNPLGSIIGQTIGKTNAGLPMVTRTPKLPIIIPPAASTDTSGKDKQLSTVAAKPLVTLGTWKGFGSFKKF